MWRKPIDVKPSPKPLDVPFSVHVASQPVAQRTLETYPQTSSPVFSPAISTHAQADPNASRMGAGLKIKGEISGNSDLFVDGEARGRISLADSKITIGPKGHVYADIEAREIHVEGSVEGNLKASERVTLGPSSRVQGSLWTPRLAVQDGARLRGKVEMTRTNESRAQITIGLSTESEFLGVIPARVETE